MELRILLFVVLLQSFVYFVPPATWNPVSRFSLTSAIVEHGRLDIGMFADATGDRAFRDGRWYTDKAPLPSLLAVPLYAAVRAAHGQLGRPPVSFVAARVQGVVAGRFEPNATFVQLLYASSIATSGLAGALLGVALFGFLCRRFSTPRALFATLAIVFGTPLFPYATSFYGHVPAALAIFLALRVLEHASPSTRQLLGQGAFLGIAIGCEYLAAVPGVVIAGFSLVRARRDAGRVALTLALGGALPIFVIGLYHTACFGAPWRTGYAFLVHPTFVAGHARGLLGFELPRPEALFGLLFGERRGLLRHWPVTAIALVGLSDFVRRHRGDHAVVAGAVALVAMFVANAGYYMWWGGAASGPRHLVPVMPLLAVGIAQAISVRAFRPVLVIVTACSVFVAFGLTFVGLEVGEHGDVVFDYLLPRLRDGDIASRRGASNLGVELGFPRVGSFGPLVAFLIVAIHALHRRAQTREGVARASES